MSRSELHLREARVDSSAGPLYVCGSIGRNHTSAVEGSGDDPPDGPVLKRRKRLSAETRARLIRPLACFQNSALLTISGY